MIYQQTILEYASEVQLNLCAKNRVHLIIWECWPSCTPSFTKITGRNRLSHFEHLSVQGNEMGLKGWSPSLWTEGVVHFFGRWPLGARIICGALCIYTPRSRYRGRGFSLVDSN